MWIMFMLKGYVRTVQYCNVPQGTPYWYSITLQLCVNWNVLIFDLLDCILVVICCFSWHQQEQRSKGHLFVCRVIQWQSRLSISFSLTSRCSTPGQDDAYWRIKTYWSSHLLHDPQPDSPPAPLRMQPTFVCPLLNRHRALTHSCLSACLGSSEEEEEEEEEETHGNDTGGTLHTQH